MNHITVRDFFVMSGIEIPEDAKITYTPHCENCWVEDGWAWYSPTQHCLNFPTETEVEDRCITIPYIYGIDLSQLPAKDAWEVLPEGLKRNTPALDHMHGFLAHIERRMGVPVKRAPYLGESPTWRWESRYGYLDVEFNIICGKEFATVTHGKYPAPDGLELFPLPLSSTDSLDALIAYILEDAK